MKFVIVAAVVLVAFWLWRNGRQNRGDDEEARPAQPAKRREPPPPQDMVSCPVCGLHLPRSDAVTGKLALYCGEEHRRSAER